MDDVCIPLAVLESENMDALIVDTASFLDELFHRYGVRLNFEPGKTEVLCQYRGRGVPALRANRYVDEHGAFPLP